MSAWEIVASCVVCMLVGLVGGGIISASIQNSRSSAIYRRLKKAFAPTPPACLTVTERQFPARIRADLQRALEDYFTHTAEVQHLCGVRYEHDTFGIDLSYLLTAGATVWEVPLQYEEVNVGGEVLMRCPRNAIWIASSNRVQMAVLLSKVFAINEPPRINIHVATLNDDAGGRVAQEFFLKLEEAVKKAQSYRGKVLSLENTDSYGGEGAGIKVHAIAPVEREDVILPAETLALVERNVLQFAAQRSRLFELHQSTKKGLLFHGPPGNGKTYTIRYLVGALKGHTTLLITGAQVAQLNEYMALARLLQPALVVIEDIDLVAKERVTRGTSCEEPLLNQLLNEMDGLAADAEIIFLLTTNRPELLEEALAARPGRIDQTIKFDPPSEPERTRLARLYAAGVELEPQVIDKIVSVTKGASAAFIKELMRRALQFHLARCDDVKIAAQDVQDAFDELVLNQGPLNSRVIGYCAPAAPVSSAMKVVE
jgi:cell division protease FtsH